MWSPDLEQNTPVAGTWPAVVFGWAALFGSSPLAAQFPNVESEIECPGCTARDHVAEAKLTTFAGTWSSALTSEDDAAWAVEDFFCFAACTPEAHDTATELLENPANAQRSSLELYSQVVAANVRSAASVMTPAARAQADGPRAWPSEPKFSCEPQGFAAQVVSPLPVEIEVEPGRLLLRYNELGVTRTIGLGSATRPHASSPLGVSLARLEDGVLVVETTGLAADRLYGWFGGAPHSDKLRAIERYSLSDDGAWLNLVLQLRDPETFTTPLVVTKRWRRTPNVRIAPHVCDVMAAQLEGVFAEYVDPAKIDARRAGLPRR